MTTVSYENDIVAWANQQAWLVRNKRFDLLDLEHIAEEIEDVGRSEQRELASRMAVLLQHLLKWQYQPARQGTSWQLTIKTQRERIQQRIGSVLANKPYSGIIQALVMGDDSQIAVNDWQLFLRTGTSHLMSISYLLKH